MLKRTGLCWVIVFALGAGWGWAADEAAELSVRGKGAAVSTHVLRDGALVNTNREYVFEETPEFLRGLQFTATEHKKLATLNCRVEKAGRVYFCFDARDVFRGYQLPDGWKSCGKLYARHGQGRAEFTVYQRDARAGETLTVAPPNRWGAVIAAKRVKVEVAAGGPAVQPRVQGGEEYEWLQQQLRERQPGDAAFEKRTAVLREQTFRREALILESDRDPLDVVLRRTWALLKDLQSRPGVPDLKAETKQLIEFENANADLLVSASEARLALFERVRKLRRRIAFANPLLDFDKIVFLKHHKSRYDHMVDQYFGFHAQPGGGVFVLEDAFGEAPRVRELLAESTVADGRLKGKRLEGGSFISLELNYDARTMLFAWTEADPVVKKFHDRVPHETLWKPSSTYHIFRANIDGSGLTQLTDGNWNEFDPCFLPSGRIAFTSERRGGYLRCGVRPDPTYTLHGMAADGSDLKTLSYHETHEWHPSVNNDGMLVYTRWDYVDRDSDIAHHLWLSYPDGRDPRSYHGNYPEVRECRPWMEMSIRAIPGSRNYVAVAAAHHGQAYGSMVLIDHDPGDDNEMSQVRRVTPDACLPESEVLPGQPGRTHGGKNNGRGARYANPWPLSEDYYIGLHAPNGNNFGIYLIDSFGNRELLYRDPAIWCLDPLPLRPRPRPPVIPDMAPDAPMDQNLAAKQMGTVALIDVYDSDFDWPEDSKITALRVIQLFPKTTPAQNEPNIGCGAQSLARGVLGTVPVEADGSAFFEAPAGMPFYFQALDARGLAVQSMKSDTYLHPGERLTCQGCHEPKRRIRHNAGVAAPRALQRAPSKIAPEAEGAHPLTYPRLVQPVLDRHCVECHAKDKKAPSLAATPGGKWGWTQSYETLSRFAWAKHGGNGALGKNGSSRSVAGQVGARVSKLFQLLEAGHYDVKLSPEELRRLTLWIDCNSNFYGAYYELEKQAHGEIVMPRLQ